MTMHRPQRPIGRRASPVLRAALALALGALAAILVACSGSGKGLIPVADAGPLQRDFEAVAQAAENGNGSCSSTESALLKTERDFSALPSSVDSGLRSTLRQGIDNLRSHALDLCSQPLPSSTLSTSAPKTTTTTSTPTTTPTETQTTTTEAPPPETPEPSGPGGGTPAPSEEAEEEGPGIGKGEGGGRDHNNGGIGVGGAGGGQEAGR